MSTAAHSRYSTVAIFLHWLIALLIIANLVGGLTHEIWTESADAADKAFGLQIMLWHKAVGVLVLALSLVRLGWRLANPAPALPAHMKGWERGLSIGTHHLFYVLMIAVPLTGWVMVSVYPTDVPFPFPFFGLFELPYLPLGHSKPLAEAFGEAHELLAFGTIGLLVLHVAAALKHHLIDRDDVLARMAPWIRARS